MARKRTRRKTRRRTRSRRRTRKRTHKRSKQRTRRRTRKRTRSQKRKRTRKRTRSRKRTRRTRSRKRTRSKRRKTRKKSRKRKRKIYGGDTSNNCPVCPQCNDIKAIVKTQNILGKKPKLLKFYNKLPKADMYFISKLPENEIILRMQNMTKSLVPRRFSFSTRKRSATRG